MLKALQDPLDQRETSESLEQAQQALQGPQERPAPKVFRVSEARQVLPDHRA